MFEIHKLGPPGKQPICSKRRCLLAFGNNSAWDPSGVPSIVPLQQKHIASRKNKELHKFQWRGRESRTAFCFNFSKRLRKISQGYCLLPFATCSFLRNPLKSVCNKNATVVTRASSFFFFFLMLRFALSDKQIYPVNMRSFVYSNLHSKK